MKTSFTNHACCVDDVGRKVDFPKPYGFMMSIFNGGVITRVSHVVSTDKEHRERLIDSVVIKSSLRRQTISRNGRLH